MKVGSLVECVENCHGLYLGKRRLPNREIGYIGIVTKINPSTKSGILVDDDRLGIFYRKRIRWREIQPPIDISELVKESIHEPVH